MCAFWNIIFPGRKIFLFICFSGGNRNKTFKPKHFPKGNKQEELLKRATATLGSGNLREAVKLQPGEDIINSMTFLYNVFDNGPGSSDSSWLSFPYELMQHHLYVFHNSVKVKVWFIKIVFGENETHWSLFNCLFLIN